MVTNPKNAPDQGDELEIEFKKGKNSNRRSAIHGAAILESKRGLGGFQGSNYTEAMEAIALLP